MNFSIRKHFMALALVATAAISSPLATPAYDGESTMPPSYVENIKPEMAAKYVFTKDGEYTKALNIPTYEWMPASGTPKAIVLGIHGLTLHGRRFRVLARSLAVNEVGFVSMDMRGFGRCRFGDYQQFSTASDDKSKINNHKSYDDIVQLATMIKQRYPNLRIIALGESLGCTFCVRLAAEHPDLITGVVLSAPAVKVNHDMYLGKGQIRQGLKAIVDPDHEMDLSGFFAELCSGRKDVQNEMLDDPMILKKIKLGALIATDAFVDDTAKFGKKTDQSLLVLILQGSSDGCVSPKHVTDLMNAMPSDHQSLAWRGNFGHLQLETIFMRIPTIDAVGGWLYGHGEASQARLKDLQNEITDLGGTVSQ